MNSEYYKDYYELERNHWWFRARMEILKMLIKKYATNSKKSNLNILNIGAATGATSQMLKKFGNVTSVEYDKECCKFLNEKLGMNALNESILDLPFVDNSYDLVCAFDVIEHVEDDKTAINEMHRVTAKDGVLFITVPAFKFLWGTHDDINHHIRRYTLKRILQLIDKKQCLIQFKSYFNFTLFFPIALFRVVFAKIFTKREGVGSDFDVKRNSKILSMILYNIFVFEKFILRKISLPVGVSIALILIKK